ncbi:MAG: bifunctional 5,10-methylenetetrahydrofolate dehydrogenase/5,10-methenyltetrahydrofolate cyclohydrolase [Candidatus Pacebacteria bacterium]|nr:bifunctional 5,10-methylenetetrahydrofolate dehydrogenase/5,10-methenyltetrahydrofolate cyclohydrolase [Candidatus Paceibacterota bacterium]
MLIDGKSIARELRTALHERVRALGRRLTLGVVVVEETPEIHKFVELKQKCGEEVGVAVEVFAMDRMQHTTENLLQIVLHATREYDGLIVQLPLPHGLDLESLLSIYPLSHDVDVIGHMAYQQFKEGRLPFNPPVVAAIAEILHREGVRLADRRVLVIGEGRLVGAPATIWAERMGARVKTVNKTTERFDEWARGADIVICGAGAPGIIHPDNIKEGVIILDAGTSESEGVLRGDADPACAGKARIFTPTPGGIGPITVAKVFENLLTLMALKEKQKQ